jgi:TfoX/Sxy family transcriptional regulator of competence genes
MIASGAGPVRTRKLFTTAGLLLASAELAGALAKSNDVFLVRAEYAPPELD